MKGLPRRPKIAQRPLMSDRMGDSAKIVEKKSLTLLLRPNL